MSAERTCGPCTVCCTTIAVEAISKRARVRCPDQTETGCACYATRPEPCRTFDCGWLRGLGETSLRPDLSGVVLASYQIDARRILHISEAREGASARPDIVKIIEAAHGVGAMVVVIEPDGKQGMRLPVVD